MRNFDLKSSFRFGFVSPNLPSYPVHFSGGAGRSFVGPGKTLDGFVFVGPSVWWMNPTITLFLPKSGLPLWAVAYVLRGEFGPPLHWDVYWCRIDRIQCRLSPAASWLPSWILATYPWPRLQFWSGCRASQALAWWVVGKLPRFLLEQQAYELPNRQKC